MLPKLPLATWINDLVTWLTNVLGPLLQTISDVVRTALDAVTNGVLWVPWWIIIIALGLLSYRAGKWKLAVGTVIGLLFVYDLQLWRHLVETLVLVVISAVVSLVIGLPIGIASSKRPRLYKAIAPLLDLLQTMPPFVYLVPVLLFFDIGTVPAMLATVAFAMPPAIRLTRLGILQVPADLVEAAQSFGSTDRQLLWKVQIPLAMPSIKAGINQTLMMSLSMVVIAAMIGASGLGADVMQALETVNVGQGFEAGLSIVILAIVLDRISQGFGQDHLKNTKED